MSLVDDKKVKEYAMLDAKIAELEGKRKQLRIEIQSSMEETFKEEGEDAVKTKYGNFKLSTSISYKYSEKVDALIEKQRKHEQKVSEAKEDVKAQMQKEENMGTAKEADTTYSLRFTKPKAK